MTQTNLKSISINNLFLLVALIASEMGKDPRTVQNLDLTSNDLRAYFQTNKINPRMKYSEFFSEEPPAIALTYRWTASFRAIRTFFDPQNIKIHISSAPMMFPLLYWSWTSLHENIWLLIRFVLFYFLGICFFVDPPDSLPRNILDATIWIDIFFVDQCSQDIAQELKETEKIYENALYHVVLSAHDLLTRIWCVLELVLRQRAGKRSQVLYANIDAIKFCQPEFKQLPADVNASELDDTFSNLEGQDQNDVVIIKRQILDFFGTPEKFNYYMRTLTTSLLSDFQSVINMVTATGIVVSTIATAGFMVFVLYNTWNHLPLAFVNVQLPD
jgi:hypothetical protein